MFQYLFDNYHRFEYPLAQVQLALFMLGMGATLSWKDFAFLIKQPRDLILGLACVLILGPLIAFGLASIVSVPVGIAMGLILIGALPGGSLSNVFTYIARGNAALSIALSGCGAVLSLFTLPFTLQLLATRHFPPDFVMPVADIIREIILFVIVPLGIGMILATRVSEEAAKKFARWVIRIGFLLVVAMVILSLGSDRMEPERLGWGPPLLIILFCLLMQQLCMLPFRLMKWPRTNFVAIGLEMTIRNVYLGILIVALLSRGSYAVSAEVSSDLLFVVLFYGAASMGCGLPLARRMRRAIGR